MSEQIETVRIVSPVTDDNPLGYIVINKSDHKGEALFGDDAKPDSVARRRRQSAAPASSEASLPHVAPTDLE